MYCIRYVIIHSILLLLIKHFTAIPKTAIVTGATGTLGIALCNKLIVSTNTLYAGCRCLSKRKTVYSSYSNLENFKLFECNFSNEENVQLPISYEELCKSKVVQLYNNAGICLNGSTQQIFRQSVGINAIKPLNFARDLIKKCSARANMRCMVLNISSGDGELLNLNSKLQSELKLLTTFDQLEEYVKVLIQNFNEDIEYSVGDTPMYSVSKAILNVGTQILQKEIDQTYDLSNRCKIISVCPGNFISPMSTSEELKSAAPIETVAQNIIRLTDLPWDNISGGKFYRDVEIIPW